MQFYSVTQKGDLFGQDVLNIWWYRRNSVGLPTDADLAALLDQWMVADHGWPRFANVVSTSYKLKQLVAQGFRDTWERTPFLPLIRDFDLSGNIAGVPGPPIQCAILAARVEPVVPGPQLQPDNTIAMRPVRRGYLAISGIPDASHEYDGHMSSTFLASATALSLASWFATAFTTASAAETMEPIRVSQPVLPNPLRGYGLIKSAHWSPLVSARRSRKVGRGG